jgi:hypothetical protein
MKIFSLLILSLLLNACTATSAVMDFPLSDQNHVGNIQILSSKRLSFAGSKDLPFAGVSALAWDEKQQILYALTDRAVLFHLKLSYQNKQITDVTVLAAYPLRNAQGKILVSSYADSEGLDIQYDAQGNTVLNIAFEHHPRVAQYTPKGKWLAKIKLPTKLNTPQNYRNLNKSLESVVYHPRYGVLTASEYPLKKNTMQQHTLYSSTGREWKFPASTAKNSAITGLAVLPNQNILLLERAWAGIFQPLVINLSELMINNCSKGKICSVKKLAKLSTEDLWRLDNFEGLTHFKKDLYLMISDDNAKPIQNTILVLFEIQK